MELKLSQYQLPEKLGFNYEELKAELVIKTEIYETMVYSDEQIKEAKSDRANLNKLKKALNDERIRMEKEYMQPFNDFKTKINELIKIIDSPVAVIDKQIREYEDLQKQMKKDEIKAMWEAMEHPEELLFEKVFLPQFLNSSTSKKVVEQCLSDSIKRYHADIRTLSDLPEFSFEAIEVYKDTLDLNMAISEGHRQAEIQKRKEEQRTTEAFVENCINPPYEEMPTEPLREAICFRAYLTPQDAFALKDFLVMRRIPYESI